MLTREVLFPAHVGPGYLNGTFSFQVADDMRSRVFGWYRNQHVYVIGQEMPLDNLTSLLHGKVPER